MTDYEHPYNALPQGYRLAEYELVRVLGSGGFGMTYLGFDDNLYKAVAIKEYLPSAIATRTTNHSVAPQASEFHDDFQWGLERFLDEVHTLARFDHRHIIKVYRYFEAHDTAYIVMEYAEGETLSDYLARQGTLSEAELKGILYPLLDGLAVVHEAGILHRDIKPGNIILRAEDGSPVLIDFGAARQEIDYRLLTTLDPAYAPIEERSGEWYQGPWTDIYALGGVCYRALTGREPEYARGRVRRDSLIPVSQRCVGQASAGFLAAIDAALSVREKDRPQSVVAWREALEASVEAQTRRQAKGESRMEQATQRLPLPTPADLAGERERFVVEVGREPSPDAVDDQDMTDLHYAAKLNLPALTLYLLSLGAAVDARNDGLTPLHFAAYKDASATAEVLLRLGADVDAINDSVEGWGETPLHFAAYEDASATAEVLLRHGAYVNAGNRISGTPLHWAARHNASLTAEVLLRHGAYVHAKNHGGSTPLYVAMEYNASETASVLRRYGGQE